MARTMEVLWTSAEGQVWDLTDLNSPVQLVSLQLPGMPAFTQQFAVSGARDGRRYEGTTFNQSDITLTVSVGDLMPLPGRKRRRWGDEWRNEMDRPWRRAISPVRAGNLTIVTGTTKRYMNLRLSEVYTIPGSQDPALIGEATYAHQLTADDQPWWAGDESPATFSPGKPGKGFFTGGAAARLYISESARIGQATITNTGDLAVYPKWWARGPFTSASVGIGNRIVTIPFPRDEGQYVMIDSGRETITDENGNSLWPLMGFSDPTFGTIEPGEEVSLITSLENSVAKTGTTLGSAIGLSIVPLFEGPW